ncbi:unnamed protein product [Porites evermanni]|uniref:C2H2-type domain-containing protein n=1 Tax=Porites evermanni TaxID=104178 RepID=A0ABN8M8R7_9CNID|nr:unnamed protein product [Porites evermanni]
MKDYLPSCISHNHMDQTRQKTEKSAESKPVKVLSSGDYLTFERHKEAQSAMQDTRTPSSRLEGLIPKIEDFHAQMEWMQCRVCQKAYKRSAALKKHEEEKHGILDISQPATEQSQTVDKVRNYTHQLLILLLLRLDHNDAIEHRDGERVTGCTNTFVSTSRCPIVRNTHLPCFNFKLKSMYCCLPDWLTHSLGIGLSTIKGNQIQTIQWIWRFSMTISCSRMTVKAIEVKLPTKPSSVLVEAQCPLTKFSETLTKLLR